MKKLCIIIPTYKRAECIKFYLESKATMFKDRSIDIIIFDSSEDSLTEEVVGSFILRGYDNIKYEKYLGDIDIKAIDEKIFTACEKYCFKYDYIWFSSDGTVINIEHIYDKIGDYMNEEYEFIVWDNKDLLGFTNKVYTDSKELFHDCAWKMTTLCANIISTKLLKIAVDGFYPYTKGNNWLWLPMVYFCVLPTIDFKAAYFIEQKGISINPKRDESFWKLSGDALWQWTKVWCETIESLPHIYDDEKEYVIKSHDKYTNIFSVRSLLSMKQYDCLSFSKVKKYKKFILRTTDTNLLWFYLISSAVNKNLILIFRLCYNKSKIVISNIKKI